MQNEEDGTYGSKTVTVKWEINPAPPKPQPVKINAPSGTDFVYNGKTRKGVASGAGYMLSGTLVAVNTGTYNTTATLMSGYVWQDGSSAAKTIKWKITKAANTLKIKGKAAAIKYVSVKSRNQTLAVTKVIKFTKKGHGKKTYQLISAKKGKKSFKKNFKINKKTGNITVKKGLKKGTYKIRVKVTASGNANYKSGYKTVTFNINVK